METTMRASLTIDDDLLNEAKQISGLPETASVEDVLRHFVEDDRRQRALEKLTGIGWDGPHHSRPTFDTLAAEFRALTAGRNHTPSEKLMREGRDER
jgi:Arc/MetJ family transcription regulator